MSDVKLCKDCAHYYISAEGFIQLGFAQTCGNPSYSKDDLVLGKTPVLADGARADHLLCGVNARGFEQKRSFWQKLGLR